MNPRELVDHIRSGPAQLVLEERLRFRRRTRSNPCDFNEFLQALQTNETIRSVECGSHRELGITEDEWVLLVKTLGSIKGIQHVVELICSAGSHNFHPFQVVADAVNNAPSLLELQVSADQGTFPRDPSGLIALATALREHTALREFIWADICPPRDLSLDSVLRALPDCPDLQKVVVMTTYASADATKTLLQVGSATDLRLVLNTEHWLAVADGIRQGRCNVKMLTLAMLLSTSVKSNAEAVKAVASAIRGECNLEDLSLETEYGFTDEAGVALAEALSVNKSLRRIALSVNFHNPATHYRAELGVLAYEAFTTMLRVNTNLDVELPPFQTYSVSGKLLESRKRMKIEQRLNRVGRGRLLASKQTTTEEYVDALHELNSYHNVDSPAFQVSCLYSLLRLQPAVWTFV
jgi:hypothetical protein